MKRRVLALVLSLVMLMMAMPMPALSDEIVNNGPVVIEDPRPIRDPRRP